MSKGNRGGRPPKPNALKVLEGSRHVNPAEPQAERGVPPCPAHLDPKAKALWKRLTRQLDAMGLMTLPDGPAMELLCAAYAEWRAARKVVEAKGASYESETQNGTIVRARPEVAIAASAAVRLRALLTEFGLTPSSRTRLQAPAKPDEVSELDAFLQGAG